MLNSKTCIVSVEDNTALQTQETQNLQGEKL
jgi:hypothetical protein